MDKKKLMLLLGAVVLATFMALGARFMLGGAAAPAIQAAVPIIVPKGPRVLVAQRALPPGTIITADAVNFQEWPNNLVRDAYFVDGKIDMNKLIGTVVRYPITAGQPLTTGALVSPGDRGFLAAALGAGMRAITITVSEKSGVAGFVFPGDHVDLMLTTSVKVKTAPTPNGSVADDRDLFATETILKNLRVLATDQSTETESANGKTIVHTAHTVTLEVTPKLAERIEVAQQGGALSLVLRSLADNQGDLDRAIAKGTVKLGENGNGGPDEAKMLASAAQSPMSGGGSLTTAGEVSRFQRRNMPPVVSAYMARDAGKGGTASGVRVTRGHDTTTTDTGPGPTAQAAGAFNRSLAGGAGAAGSAAPAAAPLMQ